MNELTPDGVRPVGYETIEQTIGRYTIIHPIGRGGMGEVLRARDHVRNIDVAIKTIDLSATDDPEALRRFEREARSALELDHPNIAKFYGMENDEKGQPFIVMEYIDGTPLDRYLADTTDIPMSQLIDFVVQTAKGLEFAFRTSIIHRDIKPSNLLLSRSGVLKIIDFGLAKSVFDNTMLTGTGMVVGTPRYVSPEQAMGRPVDHRSDIYSLGATLYELMTRQTPFDGDTPMAIMMKHINTALVPPYLLNPKVPMDVNEIVMRMMAKDASERYQDYEPLIRDLEAARQLRLAKEQRVSVNDMRTMLMPASDADLDLSEYDDIGPTKILNPAGDSAQAPDLLGPSGGIGGSHDLHPDYPSPSNHGGHSAPRSYLTEGLVNVRVADLPDLDQRRTSMGKFLLIGAAGVVLMVILVIFSMRKSATEGSTAPGPVARAVLKILGKESTTTADTPANIVTKDIQAIELTKQRMESLITKVLDYRRGTGDFNSPLRVRDLRAKNVVTTDETQDGYGNDFVMTTADGGLLRAPGRDGIEGTADDFEYTLNGIPRRIPAPLEEADLKN